MTKGIRLGSHSKKIGSGATPRGGKEAYLEQGPFSLIRSQNIYNDGFRWEGLAYISDEQARQLRNVEVLEGDVLINITGDSVARACQVDPKVLPARVNQHVAIIRPDPDAVDPRFLRYWLVDRRTQDFLLGLAAAGATRNALTKSMLEDLRVPEIDISDQREIGKTLSALDDKIALNRRMDETLEAFAQAIFKDWFVTFGPTRRKMEGATDPVAILGGLIHDPTKAAPLAALFPDSFGDDGLPEEWAVQTIEDLLELAYGKALPATKRVEGSVPVYGSGGVTGTHNSSLVEGPGIVIGRKGTVGSRYWEQYDFYPIDTVFFVRPKQDAPLEYIWELLSGLALEEMNTDAAVPGLNRSNVYRLEVPKPPASLVEAFRTIAGPIRARIEHNRAENRTLAETRDYLLPKLMSGAVRVRDAEAVIEGADA